jgi:hypothetical protein
VTQANVDAGSVTNTATASATGPEPITSAPSSVTVDASSRTTTLSLTKSTTSTGYGAPGETISYSYLVTNTGTTTLTGISVSDNRVATVSCPSSSLAPSANETCTGSYTTTSADVAAGSVTNTATASATGPVSVSSNQSSVTVDYVACTAPTITSGNSATAVAGTAFDFTVDICSRSTPTLKIAGFAKGITITYNGNGSATLSGTVSDKDSGVYSAATITASVKGQPSDIQDFTLTVDASPIFKSKDADLVHTGTAFSYSVETEYGYPAPSITTSSTLPGGVTLVDNGNGTATLSGTPDATAGGVYTLTIVATNGVGVGSPVDQTFTLTVYQAATVSLPSTVNVTPGVAMTPVAVDYAGYPAPTLKAAGLPKGLTMVNNGNGTATISGTPSVKDAAGSDTVTVTASSKAGTAKATSSFQVS